MLQTYGADKGLLSCTDLKLGGAPPAGTVWIDMFEPTPEEDRFVETLAGVAVPTREEMRDIEESSRLYTENGALYLTAPVLHAVGTHKPGIAPVTFVVTDKFLITVRYTAPQPFKTYAARALKPGNDLVGAASEPLSVLFGLIETITDRIAEHLETVAQKLDNESERLSEVSQGNGYGPMTTQDFRVALKMISKEGDFLSKTRESLAGIGRLLTYLESSAGGDTGKTMNRSWLRSLETDVNSLTGHVSFLSDRTVFLLDTVVGLVSVEQNAIIKIFSVAAVIFMPPTLVASIYGMNFVHMPELEWTYGYPMALGLMVVSAILPIIYFRFRKWM